MEFKNTSSGIVYDVTESCDIERLRSYPDQWVEVNTDQGKECENCKTLLAKLGEEKERFHGIPTRESSKADWEDYAVSVGVAGTDRMTKAELMSAVKDSRG